MHVATAATAALALLGVAAASAPAAEIVITYTTGLENIGGPDTEGLNGATATITAFVDDTSVYVDRFGFPAIPTYNETLTITGSAGGLNDGVFSVESLAYYSTFAGMFTEPGGDFFTVPLNLGSVFVQANTAPTVDGSMVQIGDTPDPADFGPTVGTSGFWNSGDFATTYALLNPTVTAAYVPEPASLAALAGVGGLLLTRRRR